MAEEVNDNFIGCLSSGIVVQLTLPWINLASVRQKQALPNQQADPPVHQSVTSPMSVLPNFPLLLSAGLV